MNAKSPALYRSLVALALGAGVSSLSACHNGSAEPESVAVDASTVIPTEEDYEQAAESAITAANLDGEIAKLEAELSETTKK